MSTLPYRNLQPRTPGWLSRSVTPLAASVGRMGLGLANFARAFTALRPLSLLRQSSLSASLLAHWPALPTIIRPWQKAITHEPWLGRVPRFEYRLRRARHEPEAADRPAALRVRIAPGDEWQPSEAVAGLFESESEVAPQLSAQFEPESGEAQAPPPWLVLPGALAPLSIPLELAGALPSVPGAMRQGALSRGRVVAARATSAAHVPAVLQRSTALGDARPGVVDGASPTMPALPPVASTADDAGVTQPAIGSQSASQGQASPIAPPSTAQRWAAALAREQAASRPAWAFRFVSPDDIAALTGEGAAGGPYRPPAMLMRAVQRSPGVSATAQARSTSSASTGTMLMRPVETMLTHVMLPAGAATAQTAGGASTAEDVTGRVLRRAARSHGHERLAAGSADWTTPAGASGLAEEREPDQPVLPVRPEARGSVDSGAEVLATAQSHGGEPASHVAREFPVLGLLRDAATQPGEARAAGERAPAAMQVLRRFTAAQMQRALMGLTALPALGRGEALPAAVRRPMELIVQRDLSNVRTYTSAVAESMGAEAFTTGERIVFAPGRMDLRSPRGLTLLAHELTHVGQPLAFKQSAGGDGGDSAEQRAGAQEAEVERIVEQGWPEAPRMDVRQAAYALSVLAQGESAGAGQRGGLQFEQRSLEGAGPSADGSAGQAGPASAALPTARLSEVQPAAGAGPAGTQPDVEKLAREVYDILKSRLLAEKIRRDVY